MKKLLSWFVLAMLMVVTLPMSSCSNDDDEPSYPAVTAAVLAGTWTKGETYKTTTKAVIDETKGLPILASITFSEGGAVTATTADGEVSGSYTLSGDKITLKAGSVDGTFAIKYRGFDTNTICLSYETTGTIAATDDKPEQTVPVTVTIHYARQTN